MAREKLPIYTVLSVIANAVMLSGSLSIIYYVYIASRPIPSGVKYTFLAGVISIIIIRALAVLSWKVKRKRP